MNRQEKQLLIESLKNEFKNSQSSFVVGVKGMTVESIQGLRKILKSKGGNLKVAKNTLLRLVAKDMVELNDLASYFRQQVAIVFSKEDTPGVAKILYDVAKQSEKFTIIVGLLEDRIIEKSKIEYLATLPSKDVLRVQVCRAIQAPITNFVNVLNQLMVKLVLVLKQISEKKQ